MLHLHPACLGVDDFALPKIYQPTIGSTSYLHPAGIATDADKLNDIRKARVCYCASEPCGFHVRLPFLGMSVCYSDVQSSLYFCTIAIFQHEINKFRTDKRNRKVPVLGARGITPVIGLIVLSGRSAHCSVDSPRLIGVSHTKLFP
jgi:hypothetical protein